MAGVLAFVAHRFGEAHLEDCYRAVLEPYIQERYMVFDTRVTPYPETLQRNMYLIMEAMRAHLGGPERDGSLGIEEDDDKWVVSFAPCGSGGRSMLGDGIEGTGSRVLAPYEFGVTQERHDWAWNTEGICYYCAHCCLALEKLPMERWGHPVRVVDPPRWGGSADAPETRKQCTWTVYKTLEAIPDEVYRPGRPQPAAAAGARCPATVSSDSRWRQARARTLDGGPGVAGGDVARLKLGVIGAGTWAVAAHLPAFAARDDVEPFIVCRRDAAVLGRIQEHFGFARATTDWHEVIAAKPDLVVLTGPVGARAEQARLALEAGAHVLAEKPFTIHPREARELDQLAQARGRTLMLCYAWNEMGIVEHARRLLLEDGGVGTVEHVSVVMGTIVRALLTTGENYVPTEFDAPPRLETWADPSVSGGGYSTGQLTHGLGLLFRLIPECATEVMAFTSGPGAAVDLHDAIALRLEGGAIGTISGTALPPGTFGNEHQLQIRITGDRGQLLLDLDRPMVRRSRGTEDDITVDLTDDDRTWSFQRVIDRFVDLAQGRHIENRSPGELGARVVDVLDGMARSGATGGRVTIEG